MIDIFEALGPDGFGVYRVAWPGPTYERVSLPPAGLLIPGFVDIHIHGAFGIDFMSASADELVVLSAKLAREGYEAFLPTTVTASPDDILAALRTMPDSPMTPGFHLEGPFISPKYPGAQPAQFILNAAMEFSAWDEILNHPKLRIVTLAPEIPGGLDLVLRLQKRGVIVSMGHTDSTYEEARRGFEFGCAHATHIFNAMRGFHHREAGTVGYALQNDALICELIYDRIHVVKHAAALLMKYKPAASIVAVSDGTMASGMPPGTRLKMWGLSCIVGRGDVRLESGALAGSAITLRHAFRNLCEDFGPELAVRACCVNPRRVLNLPHRPSLWLEFDKDWNLRRRLNELGAELPSESSRAI